MNLADVMQEVADELDTITGLRCFGYPPDKITPPAAIVTYPEDYTYDAAYGRGMDRLTVPVVVVVGKVSDRQAVKDLGKYADGSGAASVKAVLDAKTTAHGWTKCGEVVVKRAVFDLVTIAGSPYLAATFTLDITGAGA